MTTSRATTSKRPNRTAWWIRLLSHAASRAASAIAAMPLSLRIVLMLATVLHGLGLSWGLPASDAWDNDGIAPRDILPGLASTFTPGEYYTYPPLHLVLLAVLTLPVTVIAVVRAGSTSVPAVIQEIIAPPYMTAFALTARIVALLMSLGIAIALAKIAEEICCSPDNLTLVEDRDRAQRVGTFTAAIASVGTTFTYYAHTSNLDVPSLFWASIAALVFVRAIARREPEKLRRAAAFAALAIATKDQAYALFIVAAPLLLVLWFAFDSWARESANAKRIARQALIALGALAALLAILDGAVFNPTGFRARVAFLTGPASQDFSNYAKGIDGYVAILIEIGKQLHRHYPPVFAAFILAGAAIAIHSVVVSKEKGNGRPRLVAALAPLAFAISFTVAFNFAARRTDDRFILPQMLFAAVYAGFAMERIWALAKGRGARLISRVACLSLFGLAAWESMRIDLTLLYEPRYATEAFLAANVKPDDEIEVHGLNVYLPRFPPNAHVIRVGQTPVKRRGPLAGVKEVEAPLMDIGERHPRYVVVSSCFAWRYFVNAEDTSAHDGRVYPKSQQREADDVDATYFFRGLFSGRLGYRIVHDSRIRETWFRPIDIHASLNCKITTFALDANSH